MGFMGRMGFMIFMIPILPMNPMPDTVQQIARRNSYATRTYPPPTTPGHAANHPGAAMKAGWQTKQLGDVCDFAGGAQPPKSQFIFELKPGYVRFLQIRDFGSDKNITFIPVSPKNRLCTQDDILIGRYGASVGKILTGKAGTYNVALMKAIPNLCLLDRDWFYNYLISDEFQGHLLKVADRSAQAGFSKDDIYTFLSPSPRWPSSGGLLGFSTKRLRASPPPKPTPNRTSKTPVLCLKATCKPSSPNAATAGWFAN